MIFHKKRSTCISPSDTLSNTIQRRKDEPPANLTTFPKLLAADIDDTMNKHKSYELAQALAIYPAKIHSIDEEYTRLDADDKTYKGHSSQDVANEFQHYATAHLGQSLPLEFVKMNSTSSTSLPILLISYSAYSWTALLVQMQWARVIYCIMWVMTGLLLIFYGYASFFWLNKIGSQRRASIDSTLSGTYESKRYRKQRQKKPFLSGGVGGVMMGFLFFSYTASIIHNTLCADQGKKALSSGAFFIVWLVSGLLGAVLGGYIYFIAKVMTSIMGATSLTIIITAMFGIEAILIRAILLIVLVSLFTAPLFPSRLNAVQKVVLNACTSLTGMVTLLNGIALFALPFEASSNWIDLWTMLFCSNTSTSKISITTAWGSGAFKGYIAGSILGATIGFIFEFLLHHRQSGHSTESEWNEYLGTYTSRIGTTFDRSNNSTKSGLDLATSMGAAARAGLFESSPSSWQRMTDYFGSNYSILKYPAQYDDLRGTSRARLSESIISTKAKRTRSAKIIGKNAPARFQPLCNRDDFDEEESIYSGDEVDSEDEEKTTYLSSSPSNVEVKRLQYDTPTLPLLAATIIRPSSSVSSNENASYLSGTTANDSSNNKESSSKLHIPATPSLINAITRIQLAQETARNKQKE